MSEPTQNDQTAEVTDGVEVADKKPSNRSGAPKKPMAGESKAEETLYEITLHDSDEIPPNGQFIGLNGKQYLLKPGVRTAVPRGVLDILNNAVHSVPERDETMRIIRWRDAPRLPFTLHLD